MTKKSVKFEMNPLLSGPSLSERVFSGSPFRLIPVSDIDVDPDQPRRVFAEQALNDLADSIREYGVLSPILVRPQEGGTFRLVSGERRFRASKLAGLEAIPAIMDVGPESDARTLLKQMVENLQREDLGSLEKALAIGQLRDQFELSVREIAKRLGISKSMVQRSLEVLQLPEDLQAALIAGASESKVLMLANVSDRSLRALLVAQLEDLSRKDIEKIIAEGKGSTDKVSHGGTAVRKSKEPSSDDRRLVEQLQRSLGTKVNISRSDSSPEKGRLILDFYSASDLEEIYNRLSSE
jgi:ParB family chromosome partitioning protein